MNARRDRVLLPGWWRFWDCGPQWSPTARRHVGIPGPGSEAAPCDDWQLWETELQHEQDQDSDPNRMDDPRGMA